MSGREVGGEEKDAREDVLHFVGVESVEARGKRVVTRVLTKAVGSLRVTARVLCRGVGGHVIDDDVKSRQIESDGLREGVAVVVGESIVERVFGEKIA